ncbi:MAG: RDD family protein [Bacteroidales bacterium]|nr:RDD family protein [Bacteroidales bacterium]
MNQNQTTKVQYAGFWWRFLAFIIDEIILSFVETILILPFIGLFGISIFSLNYQGYDTEEFMPFLIPLIGFIILLSISAIIINWLYFALMESSNKQSTLGKMVLNIKVTDMEGNKISFARATGRYFGKIISGMIFYIGFIIAGFTEKKQALHDLMASCLVIKE